MKIGAIVDVFSQKNKLEQPLVVKVLDTIGDFKRRIELKPAFRELRQVFEDYQEENQKYIKELIKEYCNEFNDKKKNIEGFEELDPENINRVPETKINKHQKEIEDRRDVEIELKIPLKFYEDEIERSKILFSEMEILDEFVEWGKNKPSPKKKDTKHKK